MEPFHWVFLAIGAFLIFRVLFGLKKSAANLSPNQLPEKVLTAARETLAEFQMESASSIMGRKFVIRGTYRGNPGKMDVELGRDGEVDEVEYDEILQSGSSKFLTGCELSEIPDIVRRTIQEVLGEDHVNFQPYRASKGKVNGEGCYKVKGRLPGWKWEFEVLESGRLIELERDRSRTQ